MSYKQISPLPIVEGGTNAQILNDTNGTIYFDGTSIQTIAPGTTTHVLTSNGSGSAPSYQSIDPSGTNVISFVTGDTGIIAPIARTIAIKGGTGIVTSGSGATLTITATGDVTTVTGNSGTATPSSGTLNITGDGTILTTSGSGNTLSLTTASVYTVVTSSGTATASANAITFVGASGITTSATGSTVTITGSGSSSGIYPFTNVTSATQSMVVNTGYISNDGATLVTFTLPTTAAVGQVVAVQGSGSGLFTIAQNALQVINFNAVASTVGTGGSVSSTSQFDSIYLMCVTANTTWVVNQSMGNFNVI